jgi:hypothetical protein
VKNDNTIILARLRGVPAHPGNPDTDADPRNPVPQDTRWFDNDGELSREARLLRQILETLQRIERHITAKGQDK